MGDKIIIPDPADIAIYGSWPARTEITVLPADDPQKPKIGWSIVETVGIGVVNPRGIFLMAKCCLCQGRSRISKVDINLKLCDGDDTYPICPKCRRGTRKILRQMNKMDPKDLPLSISDPNIFVRIRAAALLQRI